MLTGLLQLDRAVQSCRTGAVSASVLRPGMGPRVSDGFAREPDPFPADSKGRRAVGLTVDRVVVGLREHVANRRAVTARHILLVDDDANVRKALRRLLALDGHRVEVASDGLSGVELALAMAPEVAFIDIGLPGIDGHEVARRIRAGLGNRALLVAVTAHGREQDRRRSSEAGFDAHLLKPVSYDDLTRLLGQVRVTDA